MASRLVSLVGLAVLAAAATPASAHDYKAGPLTIAHPWSRATPGGAKVGGGYLTVTNSGTEPDRLVGGSTPVAERFELHQTTVTDGVASMRPVEGGLVIRPGETVELKPGGTHVMLVNLKGPLKEGSCFPGTLTFEKAGAVPVEFTVQALGASGNAGGHAGHQHSGGPAQ